jgi:hypothetical protein
MSASALETLEVAIRGAESVGSLLDAESPGRVAAAPISPDQLNVLDGLVWAGAFMGETLPMTWRLTFDNLFGEPTESWTTIQDFEAARNGVRKLFFTCREGMDKARVIAETIRAITGQIPPGMDRLLKAIENARLLELEVFRDWPPFADALPPVDPADRLTSEESLAEILGITEAQAREKMDARRHELNMGRG